MRYKLTFKMQSAMIAYEPIIFDSLLLYLYIKKMNGVVPQHLILKDDDIIELPTELLKRDEKGFYYSSIMMTDTDYLSDISNFTKHWHRADEDLLKDKKLKILTQKGTYKSYLLPMETRAYDKVFFIFDTDNIDLVEELIKDLSSLGKKRHRGYGLIDSYTLEPTNEKIIRPVPTDDGDIYMTLTPPYWRINNLITQKLVEL